MLAFGKLAKSGGYGRNAYDNKWQQNAGLFRHLHAFRGFAILNIVTIHALAFQIDAARNFYAIDAREHFGASLVRAVNEAFFHDSTLYFALISGLLFSLVLHERGWRAFFVAKVQNVVSPYVVMTLLFTFYGLNRGNNSGVVGEAYPGSLAEYLSEAGGNLVTGGAISQLWYIPILILLYLATPLMAYLLARKSLWWIIWLIVLAPLVASRSWPDFSLATLFYFLGAYVTGMVIGNDYLSALALFKRHRAGLALLSFSLTLMLIGAYLMDMDALGFVSVRETLFYVQKLSLAALVLVYFHAVEKQLPKFLDTLGSYAFSIYFLHVILIAFFIDAQLWLLPEFSSTWVLVAAGILTLVFALAGSLLISVLMQRLLGSKSRLLIGA